MCIDSLEGSLRNKDVRNKIMFQSIQELSKLILMVFLNSLYTNLSD